MIVLLLVKDLRILYWAKKNLDDDQTMSSTLPISWMVLMWWSIHNVGTRPGSPCCCCFKRTSQPSCCTAVDYLKHLHPVHCWGNLSLTHTLSHCVYPLPIAWYILVAIEQHSVSILYVLAKYRVAWSESVFFQLVVFVHVQVEIMVAVMDLDLNCRSRPPLACNALPRRDLQPSGC
jgi:hypothetical protein